MSQATVRIPTPLRSFTAGASEVTVEGATVGEAIRSLVAVHQGLGARILDADGNLRNFVNVYLNDSNIRTLGGLDADLPDGCTLHIVPAVAGGMHARQRRLMELKQTIPEITPVDSFAEQHEKGAVLLDVREPDEVAGGSPVGAIKLVRGFLELEIETRVPDLSTPIIAMCAGGVRSLFAAQNLRDLGYENVRSMSGGFNGWKNAGLPMAMPRVLTQEERERYGRHLTVPEVGEEGQVKLLQSKVLMIGAGGLGSPAAYYLAAAGVGTIGLIDDDVVDRSNLQRQILHADDRVGMAKVESAKKTLQALNPSITVNTYQERLVAGNVDRIFEGYDLVIDGTDNFTTRYLVNDACLKFGIPNVHGAIFRFEGQLSVFWPDHPEMEVQGPCYRCLFPEPPPPELAPSCAEAGVLGILPGVVGTLEAVEAIKLLLGIGEPLIGRLVLYDALSQRFTEMKIERNPECKWCGDGAEITEYAEYGEVCAA